MTFEAVVACAGRVVQSPECYGLKNNGPKVTRHDAPPQPSTPDNQHLEGLDGCRWANLSLLQIDEPKSY
jgi:hypothetical protein